MGNFIDDGHKQVTEWQRKGTYQLWLLFAVGLLGITVSGMQKSSSDKAKAITFAVGLTISGLTLASKMFFDSDSKAYARAANHGVDSLRRLEMTRTDYRQVAPDAKADLWKQFRDEMDVFNKVRDGLSETDHNVALASPIDSVVYASDGDYAPAWTRTNGERQNSATYYVGTGINESLQAAKHQAKDNALFNGAQSLLRNQEWDGSNPEEFAMMGILVEHFTTNTDEWTTFDSAGKRYVCFYRILLLDDARQKPPAFDINVPSKSLIPMQGESTILFSGPYTSKGANFYILTSPPVGFPDQPFVNDGSKSAEVVRQGQELIAKCQPRRFPKFDPRSDDPRLKYLNGCVHVSASRLNPEGANNYLGYAPFKFHLYEVTLTSVEPTGIGLHWNPVF